MPTVKTSAITAGMRLSAPAVAPDGDVVLPAGTVIDTDKLAHLSSRRIRRVEVTPESFEQAADVERNLEHRDDADDGDLELRKASTAVMNARLVRIARMFSDYREDPLMRELCRLAIKCAQERLVSV